MLLERDGPLARLWLNRPERLNALYTPVFEEFADALAVVREDGEVRALVAGAFRVAQACLGGMRERGYGRIVLMSSMAATIGGQGQVAYAASKAGLLGAMRTIALENARHGITVNAVLPGMIATPRVEAMPAEVLERAQATIHPAVRFGEPAEVAALVSFLVSEQAGYVTAQTIGIDGGMSLNHVSLGNPDHG